ncbi:MAG: dihydropteroate synthase [Rhodothermaceae bacterium]|nr:dihydropteroate synthase [Rhodothermaceae bacterium]MYF64250.1 dihydropteroate synthase [Rhodothermaceae bacterium]MYI84597.1 dihydropteroate synthase [Rhodothermaceae bacterium]
MLSNQLSRTGNINVTMELVCREHQLNLSDGTVVMGVLNVTPDSFYDGGRYLNPSEALQRVEVMLDEGARIIDVGGASSRPRGQVYGAGAAPVPTECEINRILPVINAIRQSFPEAIISVDTFNTAVATVALKAGAHMINDISGLWEGVASAEVAGRVGAAYVVMHSIKRRGSLVHEASYDGVVAAVCQALSDSADRARSAGVTGIVVDPGFGFGKRHADNLHLIQHLDILAELGYPVLVGISRKSTVGRVLSRDSEPAPVSDRLFGSLGMTAAAVLRGANIIRTHDVRATCEMIKGLEAVLQA